uniref:Ubiquitin conjugating enzyme E2 J2 n=1 Tax=Cyanoderma ruficeps TaxID=181631 RepID=A0A8C3QGB7_9PASS
MTKNRGYYHGKLIFPREFPFKPPSIYMITPNGRFKCNTRLCLSITDFHPDTWNPAWSVSTILTGLLSFMVEKGPTLGSIETSEFTVSPALGILGGKNGQFGRFRGLKPHWGSQFCHGIENELAWGSQSCYRIKN